MESMRDRSKRNTGATESTVKGARLLQGATHPSSHNDEECTPMLTRQALVHFCVVSVRFPSKSNRLAHIPCCSLRRQDHRGAHLCVLIEIIRDEKRNKEGSTARCSHGPCKDEG